MKISNYSNTPRAVSENIVTQELGVELLIYDLKTHRAMSLNAPAACVWELCDGKNTLPVIAKLAESKLKSPIPEEAIILAIDKLYKNNLLIKESNSAEAEEYISALSRRAMIRRVGLTAAVAIPVITAITAPKAIHAASAAGKPDGASCNTDSECLNQCCLNNVCNPPAACFI